MNTSRVRNHIASTGFIAMLAVLFAPSHAFAQDTYYWINAGGGAFPLAANWSLNPDGIPAAGAAPGASDLLVFNSDGLNVDLTVDINGFDQAYHSMTFANTGSTQVNRAASGGANFNTITLGSGGITLLPGAGAVTFGNVDGDNDQRVNINASESLSITNNSSSLLKLTRNFFSSEVNGSTVLTFDGSGSGGTEMVGDIGNGGTGSTVSVVIDTTGGGVTTFVRTKFFSGGTTLQQGILALGDNSALGSGGLLIQNGTLAASGVDVTIETNISVEGDFSLGGQGTALTMDGTMDLGGETRQVTIQGDTNTIGGVISNGGLVVNAAAGTLVLNAENTYTGETTITAGTLQIGASGALAESNVTISSGASLDVLADGSIANSPEIVVNGTLNNADPLTIGDGNSIGGNGTVSGSLHFEEGAIFSIHSINDTLTVNGASVSFDGFGIVNLAGINFDAVAIYSPFTLINGSAAINFANVNNLGFGNRVSVGTEDREAYFQEGSLQLVVIPEPSSMSLLALALGTGLLAMRRRKS